MQIIIPLGELVYLVEEGILEYMQIKGIPDDTDAEVDNIRRALDASVVLWVKRALNRTDPIPDD